MSVPTALVHGWRTLRLAAAAPDRVPGWDAVILTASGPGQAALYRHQLAAMVRRGRLPPLTRTLVVEDPQGKRIGSGGATLHALRAIAGLFGGAQEVAKRRILLVHAGGDSRRLPWASVVGKAFIPVPLVADPDHACPSLLDHLAALVAGVPARLRSGGMVVLSGDVLPLAALDALPWPDDGLAVVTVPASATLAGRHGVIAARTDGTVSALLQKPSPSELEAHGALLPGGLALLDTGVWAFAGQAVTMLARLATDATDVIAELLRDGRECSMYEEIPAACLPDRAAWLADRPLGPRLAAALRGQPMVSLRADRLRFLHLGTGSELLEHLSADWNGHCQQRLLASCGPAVADTAIVIESRCDAAARIGAGSVIIHSRLAARARIGRRCVVQGVDAPDEPLDLPDHHAVWQVPVETDGAVWWVTAWCGVDDNPKAPFASATLGNRPLSLWLSERGLRVSDLWPDGKPATLWTARLFPATLSTPALGTMAWMVGDPTRHPAGADVWKAARRWSLAELAAGFLPDVLIAAQQHRTDRVALDVLAQVATHALDRDAAALAGDLSPGARPVLLTLAETIPEDAPVSVARRHWLSADLLAAAGAPAIAARHREQAWTAISSDLAGRLETLDDEPAPPLPPGQRARADLPARIDLAGGWTDTPPICFDLPARVCNLAITIAGRLPIGAEVEIVSESGLHLSLDGPDAPPSIHMPWSALTRELRFPLSDPYALPKTALLACGWAEGGRGGAKLGLRLHAWSHLPRGSGLGGSSILAAAIVRALCRLAKRSDEVATVSNLVLTVEQRLSTGGGWQDQLGGLVPGAKLLTSLPQSPLRIAIEPITLAPEIAHQLSRRLLIIDTGITRLAKNVLQRVVGSHLARRHGMARSISRLAEVATATRDALAIGDWEALGEHLREAWSLNQTLDPHCSNPAVDAGFAGTPYPWKLAGAGGGGFAVMLRPDHDQTVHLPGMRSVAWTLCDEQMPSR